jgi:hypothetical protein
MKEHLEDTVELIDALYAMCEAYQVEITVSIVPGLMYDAARHFGTYLLPQRVNTYSPPPYFQHGPVRVEPQLRQYEHKQRSGWAR